MASNSIKLLPPASSGSFGYNLSINGYEVNNSWDIASNTSTIYLEAVLKSYGNASFTGSSNHTLELWIYDNNEHQNGVQVASSIVKSLSGNKSTNITANYTLNHKADGSLNVKLVSKWNKVSSNKYVPISGETGTDYFQCYTIPRTSSLSLSDFYVEDGTTIRINSASSSFTHTLFYQYTGKEKKLISSNIRTEYYWKPDNDEFYGYITDSSLAGTVTIFCETYNGGMKIGDSSANCTVRIKPYTPIISIDYIKDINQKTVALTGDETKLILGYSTVEIKSTYSAIKGASILSYAVINNDVVISDNPGTINAPSSNRFIISVEDSRGINSYLPINMQIQDYVPLVFKKFEAVRLESTSSKINIDFTLAYFGGNFGTTQNIIGNSTEENKGIVKVQYKENESDDWIDLESITIDTPADGTSTQYSGQLSGDFSYQKAYYFQVYTSDKLQNTGRVYYVTQGVPLIDKGETFVDVHGELTGDIVIGQEFKMYNKASEQYSNSFFPTEDYVGDVNKLTRIGIYRINVTATNKPSSAKGICLVMGDEGVIANDRLTFYQIFFSYDGNIYYRSSDTESINIFGDWKTINHYKG